MYDQQTCTANPFDFCYKWTNEQMDVASLLKCKWYIKIISEEFIIVGYLVTLKDQRDVTGGSSYWSGGIPISKMEMTSPGVHVLWLLSHHYQVLILEA